MMATSQFLQLRVGSVSVLDILFSHCNVPVGEFAFATAASTARHSRLFVNTADNDWYQRGIPGLTNSIQETADYLRRLVRDLGATRVRTIGCSMGAYAAILYGDILDADQVIACDPEIEIGQERMRSWEWNRVRIFSEPRDIRAALRRLHGRALVSFGVQDPMEARSAMLALEAGLTPALTKFVHGNPWHIDWPRVFANPEEAVRAVPRLLVEPPSALALGQAAALYWQAYGRTARPGGEQYSKARGELPSLALYDAVLHCQHGDAIEGEKAMRRYVSFRREEEISETVDVLDDIERRFSFAPPQCWEVRDHLMAMLSN